MAMSSATATTYISHTPPPDSSFKLRPSNLNHVSFVIRPKKLVVRSSDEASSATEKKTTEKTESPEESPVQVPEGPPSLISPLNVEKALRGIAITDADHYGRLGLQRGCPYDQVLVAYKNKVGELMSQALEEQELNSQLDLLKESYTILSTVEERRLYDWSLARSETPERYTWPFEQDITQTPKEKPPPQEPEDEGPTRLVGYFMLGWLVIAFTLSIALNR
ncbi:hypothetical protein Ancab_001864 [Ancistrocladus abbreviatus]